MSEFVERTELLLPGPAQAFGSLLNVPTPDFEGGAGLPILWHWLYTLERPAQADLGRDGHPVRGTIPAPPGPGRRRMWAGGQVRTRGVLRVGEPATRRTEVLSVQQKHGSTGPLTFVTVGHEISQRGEVKVWERQDIVYRDACTGAAPSKASQVAGPAAEPPALPAAPEEWDVDVTPVLLFRFSALTYNGHRIHYDRDYARDVEGYPGLVTHGPLQAMVMAEQARAQGRTGDQVFSYRLVSPLFDHQGMVAGATRQGAATATWVRDRYGRRTATGELSSA
jgi:3-methylfumaryl-CoA hydratase